jgi:RNA polymerase II subunit A small phosphatase-like protein
MRNVIIVDNSPAAYMFQPENALPILSWYDDTKDKELSKLVPVLEKLAEVDDVSNYIRYLVADNRIMFNRAAMMLNH